MYADEKLKQHLRDEWDTLMNRVMEVNSDLGERFHGETLVFDLDRDQDRLNVSIGDPPRDTYTQGLNHVYFDLDVDTDTIAAVTIRDVSAYMEEKATDHVWMSLMDILRLVRTIEVPPGVGADAGRDAFAQQLRQLVFT